MRLGLCSSTMHRKQCSKHLHNHADITARIRVSIVLTLSWRSGLGRSTYCTPPGIDLAVALFGLLIINLCLDVLFHRYGLVFGCYIVIEYCDIVMEICGLVIFHLYEIMLRC
jgi:hypothetical protein